MTTDPRATTGSSTVVSGFGPLVGAASAALGAGLVMCVIGALMDGSEAVLSSLVGSGLALLVFVFGAVVVNTVAAVMPRASLLVALLTYTLQVLVMGLVFWGLTTSGALDESLDRTWLGVSAIVVTMVWMLAHVVLVSRARIPVYDLPSETPSMSTPRSGGQA